jgi:hypothetical protein
MKQSLLSLVVVFLLTASSIKNQENVEFSCFKKHKATNTCHFNFIVDGVPYRFVDIGCKWESKREEVIGNAKEGNLALAKDWKIACPAAKKDDKTKPAAGF